MFALGIVLGVGSGVLFATAAAIEKHEAVKAEAPVRRLLVVLGRRPVWLAGLLVGGLAWIAQAAATAVYTKVVGDAVAVHGSRAFPSLVRMPAPWLLVGLSLVALALVQEGFRRANAASVVASMTTIDSAGPIIAGFSLFHEPFAA